MLAVKCIYARVKKPQFSVSKTGALPLSYWDIEAPQAGIDHFAWTRPWTDAVDLVWNIRSSKMGQAMLARRAQTREGLRQPTQSALTDILDLVQVK